MPANARHYPDRCPTCGEPVAIVVNGRCPHCEHEIPARAPSRLPHFLSLPPMRYQNRYVWLVFLSAMDIILTALVLFLWRGREANPLAGSVILRMGFGWTILFKFGMMLAAIIACEVVGRRNDKTGRRLATVAVMINALPVIYTLALLLEAGPPAVPHPADVHTGVGGAFHTPVPAAPRE